MKPFTSKHSIAAGSPVHMGGSSKESPLEQRVQPVSPHPAGAEAYYSPPGFDDGGYYVVGNKPQDYQEPFTPEQLATRIDVVSGNPIDYNTTHGTVEIQGSDDPYGLRKRKSINLEDAELNKSSTSAVVQRASRNTEVPITNLEMSENKWSSKNRQNYPRQTRSNPVTTAAEQDERFINSRTRDSIGTMNNRNIVALNQNLASNNQYLRPERLSEDQMKLYGFLPKQ